MIDFDSIPSNHFSYNANRREFFAEASDLNGYDILQRPRVSPMGKGFAIRSTRTGKVVNFYYLNKLEVMEDYDGELYGWLFESECQTYKVVIVND